MTDKASLSVVAAIIQRDGRFLIAQRPKGKHLALKWEFPGGKVEPGEALEKAMVREIEEELGCSIELTQALPAYIHASDKILKMHPFLATLRAGSPDPKALEHAALCWVELGELKHYDLAAADLPILKALGAS